MSVSFGEVVESSLEPQYARVISVGSAEGYFAVGYPWRNPAYEVFCFDIDPVSRQQVRRLAKMSGVSKRVILNRLLVGHVLTVMDVEGYETILLDTEKVPYLAHTDMLVGLHEVHGADQETVECFALDLLPPTGLPDTQARGAGIGRKPTALFAKKNFHKKSCSRALMRVIGSQHWLWMAANDKFGEPTPRKH
jgi:hypothetical protein